MQDSLFRMWQYFGVPYVEFLAAADGRVYPNKEPIMQGSLTRCPGWEKVLPLYTSSSDPQKRNTPQEKTVKFGSFDDAAGHEKIPSILYKLHRPLKTLTLPKINL